MGRDLFIYQPIVTVDSTSQQEATVRLPMASDSTVTTAPFSAGNHKPPATAEAHGGPHHHMGWDRYGAGIDMALIVCYRLFVYFWPPSIVPM